MERHVLRARVGKRLGEFELDVDLAARNELLVLFGPSGSGKSITLRAVAGLVTPDAGRIAIGETVVFDHDRGVRAPARERPVAWVPQGYSLFPHMTARQNIGFGMPRRMDAGDRIDMLLALLGLDGLGGRYPRTLSGGQQQRVALARALARNADVLLLDEPFSALDEALRAGLRDELLRLRRELGLTIVFVTHDLREAHLLADRLAVLDEGRILQIGERDDVFRRPASRRVAELTGVQNLLAASQVDYSDGRATVDADGVRLVCGSIAPGAYEAARVVAGIRAERVNLRRIQDGAEENHVRGWITGEWAYGNTHTLRFAPTGPGPELMVEIASRPYEVLHVAEQREWLLELPPEDLHLMPA